jgi:hypothetical protein
MPFPCPFRLTRTYHAVPLSLKANSHMSFRAPAILRQCRGLREIPRGSRKYPTCYSHSLTDWYASNSNFRGTPRGSRKKPNAGRSPICRLWTADANSHMSYHAHAALGRGLEKSLSERHGRDMECLNQTRPRCINQMGKTQSKPLAARYGRGMAWERHGICNLAFTEAQGLLPCSLDLFKRASSVQTKHSVSILFSYVPCVLPNDLIFRLRFLYYLLLFYVST